MNFVKIFYHWLVGLKNQPASFEFNPIQGSGGFQTRYLGVHFCPTFENFFTVLLGFLTTVGGIWFMLYFIFGSFTWLTAQGEPEKISKAQKYITNALIGLILIVGAWAIIGVIGLIFDYNILDLSGNLDSVIGTPDVCEAQP